MIKIIRAAAKRTLQLVVILVLAVALAAVAFIFGAAVTDYAVNRAAPRLIPLTLEYRI